MSETIFEDNMIDFKFNKESNKYILRVKENSEIYFSPRQLKTKEIKINNIENVVESGTEIELNDFNSFNRFIIFSLFHIYVYSFSSYGFKKYVYVHKEGELDGKKYRRE